MLRRVPLFDIKRVIDGLQEKEDDERMFRMWLQVYPNMTTETFVSFEEFNSSTKYDKRSINAIKAEINEIEAMFNK